MIRNILMSTLLSLKAHKLRVFLTMTGIIIGIASVITIAALGEGVRQESLNLAQSTGANVVKVRHQISQTDETGMSYIEDTFAFSRADMRRVSRVEGVKQVLPDYGSSWMSVDAIDTNLNYFGAQAWTMVMAHKNESPILYGRDLMPYDINRDVIVLSHDILDYGIAVDDPEALIGQAVEINGYMFEIIGIKEPFDYSNEGINFDFSYSWEDAMLSVIPQTAYNYLTNSRPISSLRLSVADNYDKSMVASEVIDNLMIAYPDDEGYFEEDRSDEEMVESVNEYINSIMLFLIAITAISLFVGGIGVMNIMYVSVTERKREIGIRRAIGAKPRMILLQFLLEAAFITFLGGLVGLALGYGIASLIGMVIGMPVYLTPGIMLLSTSVSIGTGLVFGIIPALSASRMDPIKAIYM